jgi:mannose-6-phosphate isomerase
VSELYPYILQPKLTPAIWGGDALVRIYGKHGDANKKFGESWECFDENRVQNGDFAGRTIAELRALLGSRLLGDLDPQRPFPILTKIIDAHDSLSVQVHPDDAYAQRVEHQPNGKTECWYVLHAEPGAELVLGWNRNTSREEYERRVADGTLGEILRRVPVEAGDAYYLPAGTLHAIGAGIVLFETQQTSDLTYRIFDWNRVGADGKPRELHVQKAGDVLDYGESHAGATMELAYAFEGFQRTALIADARFLVERVTATETRGTMSTHGRPIVLMALERPVEVSTESAPAVELPPYTTALVPAASQNVCISSPEGQANFMYVTPPGSQEAIVKRLHDAGVAQATIEAFVSQFVPSRAAAA